MVKKKIVSKSKLFNECVENIKKAYASNNSLFLIENLKKALQIEPMNYAILNELGNAYSGNSKYEDALKYYLKALLINKDDSTILSNIGVTYLNIENFDLAVKYLLKALDINPGNYQPYVNLGGLYNNIGDYKSSVEISIRGISINPSESLLHYNLSVALVGLGLYNEAMYSAKTAKKLDEKLIDIGILIASIDKLIGNHQEAQEYFVNFLDDKNYINHPKVDFVKWSMAEYYLKDGKLDLGWEYYRCGFSRAVPITNRRMPNRAFNVPRWSGIVKITNSTLMIWAEQGVGDELLFMTIIPDLMLDVSNLIIECDLRLHSILRRTYPSIKFRAPSFNCDNGGLNIMTDYDFHYPMGDLPLIYRGELNKFENKSIKLIPNPDLNLKFKKRLDSFKDFKKIGICWRSGKLDPQRNIEYTSLIDWKDIFALENVIFVNLQYGECEHELIQAEEKYGINIIRWQDLDLKNDLEGTFSLISELDFVISAATAVACMSYSLGKTTLMFSADKGWPNLGTDYFPWAKCVKIFFAGPNNIAANTLPTIAKYIKNHLV